jgi:hypothetical protein
MQGIESPPDVAGPHACANERPTAVLQKLGKVTASYLSNTGVEPAGPNKFLPRDDWSEPSSIADDVRPLNTAVTVLDLGTDLSSSIRRRLPLLLDPERTSDDSRRELLDGLAGELVERLTALGVISESVRVSNVAVNPPGIRSTGRDFVTNQYVGLHIDNHDKLRLADRAGAVQLLALNCGASDRYFHYVDVPVARMAAMTGTPIDGDEDPKQASDGLKNRFLERFGEYPVIRVVLPPGHAYIATPQNLIHDGAGGSVNAADVAFLMLGRYRRAN